MPLCESKNSKDYRLLFLMFVDQKSLISFFLFSRITKHLPTQCDWPVLCVKGLLKLCSYLAKQVATNMAMDVQNFGPQQDIATPADQISEILLMTPWSFLISGFEWWWSKCFLNICQVIFVETIANITYVQIILFSFQFLESGIN